jgi:CDP-diacylglycerol---glycerol-3-phosphate 3-phosphatidyltransferase
MSNFGKPDYLGDPVNNVPLINIPNALTCLRLILVPIFGYLLLAAPQTTTNQWISATVFLVAALTDFMDGLWARRYGLITNFGKIADPIADKALIGTALVGLSLIGEVAWWVTVVILVREVAVTLLRFRVIKRGVLPASRGGKVKTVSQIVAIVAYLIPMGGWVTTVANTALGVALALTVLTGIDYAAKVRYPPS